MKCFSLCSIVTAAFVALSATMTAAQPQPRKMMLREHHSPMGLAEQLNLTDEQKEQIHQAMVNTRKKSIDIEAKGKVGRIELHELLAAETPDQKKIDAKIAELSQLHEMKMRARVESMLAIQKLLTPEQRKKAKELRLLERFGHGHGGEGMRRRFFRAGMGMGMHHDDEQL